MSSLNANNTGHLIHGSFGKIGTANKGSGGDVTKPKPTGQVRHAIEYFRTYME